MACSLAWIIVGKSPRLTNIAQPSGCIRAHFPGFAYPFFSGCIADIVKPVLLNVPTFRYPGYQGFDILDMRFWSAFVVNDMNVTWSTVHSVGM